MLGNLLLPRSIMDSEFYLSERFTKMQAWLDLLLLANSKPASISIRGVDIMLLAGETAYSIRTLSDRWQWNKRTVTKFLDYLSDSKLITYTPQNNLTTIVKIANFERLYAPQNSTTSAPPYYIDVTNKKDSFRGMSAPQNLDDMQEAQESTTLQVKNNELSTMTSAPQNYGSTTSESGKKTEVSAPQNYGSSAPQNYLDTTGKSGNLEGMSAPQNDMEKLSTAPQNYGVDTGQSGKKTEVSAHRASKLAYIYTSGNSKNNGSGLTDSSTEKIPAFKGRNKPDDIPDEIWDKAFELAMGRRNVKYPVKLAEIIARQDLMPQYERQQNAKAKLETKTFNEDNLSEIDRTRLEKMKARERATIGGDQL